MGQTLIFFDGHVTLNGPRRRPRNSGPNAAIRSGTNRPREEVFTGLPAAYTAASLQSHGRGGEAMVGKKKGTKKKTGSKPKKK